ncbi:MAG: hypothetical protein NLN65_02020 [Candidatus Poseidoniaceae archaeon]|nr:hypothetical protein [Candidatus Poseidoniaceae archaeon]|tara:strand:- start:669 stop:1250 length:582 start_codon:yes stop_codon:yes gene_type:complete
MARTVKATKVALKEADTLVESLRELVWIDLKNQYTAFEEMLQSRISDAEEAILDATKGKLAIIAGIGVMRKDLERAQRRFTRSNEIDKLREFLVDLSDRIFRLREANDSIVESLKSVLNPHLNAIEIVEKFASDLQRSAGTWERNGREIDESIYEICDDHEPAELSDFEQFISKQGYEALVELPVHSSSDEEA